MSNTTLKMVSRFVRQSNVILPSIAAAATHIPPIQLMASASLVNMPSAASFNIVLDPAGWGAKFLGEVMPYVSIIDGFLTSSKALMRCFDPYNRRGPIPHLLDFLAGLPLMFEGYHALGAATWPLSLVIVAHGYAVTTGYKFIKEIAYLSYRNSHPDQFATKRGYNKLITKGLEFAGFMLISLGLPYFTAGFVCLALATLLKNKTIQNLPSSIGLFSSCCRQEKQPVPRARDTGTLYRFN